jgi:hypothetical protein
MRTLLPSMPAEEGGSSDVSYLTEIPSRMDPHARRWLDIGQRTGVHITRCARMGFWTAPEWQLGLASVQTFCTTCLSIPLPPRSSSLQQELLLILSAMGTHSLDDLLRVAFGTYDDAQFAPLPDDLDRFHLLKTYFRPLRFHVVSSSACPSGFSPTSPSLTCRPWMSTTTSSDPLDLQLNGLRLLLRPASFPCLVVSGWMEPVSTPWLSCAWLQRMRADVHAHWIAESPEGAGWRTWIQSVTLTEFLVHSPADLYQDRCLGRDMAAALLRPGREPLVQAFTRWSAAGQALAIRRVLREPGSESSDLWNPLSPSFAQDVILALPASLRSLCPDPPACTHSSAPASPSSPASSSASSPSARAIDPWPWMDSEWKRKLKAWEAPSSVKEKAALRIKDMNNRQDDSGAAKARQYVEGLMSIPFGVLRQEPILTEGPRLQDQYARWTQCFPEAPQDMGQGVSWIQTHVFAPDSLTDPLTDSVRELKVLVRTIRAVTKEHPTLSCSLRLSRQSSADQLRAVRAWEQTAPQEVLAAVQRRHPHARWAPDRARSDSWTRWIADHAEWTRRLHALPSVLDRSVHGHAPAKQQLVRWMGQWARGASTQGGCIGFEGPPGVGKTSLAQHGLSQCLCDAQGLPRPFAMIQLGGHAQSSTLQGHSYTFVSSMWGTLAQILMDTKCMNPIVLLDEVDKVSSTDQGREIIGVLTHVLDPSVNQRFQDKYFAGIDLDFSNVLFVLSYNDPSAIDRVLMDRVHRISFQPLTLDEKKTIVETHVWPELLARFRREGQVVLDPDVVERLVEHYTCEAGIRKLKERLFEVLADLNWEWMHDSSCVPVFPWTLTWDKVLAHTLKAHRAYEPSWNRVPAVGVVHGLWANAVGQGGVLPIQAQWCPGSSFLSLTLTGLQGDVMKESMQVALTVAWNHLTDEQQRALRERPGMPGIHVHCPEGGTPKDGPSAGTAIAVAMYSLMVQHPVRPDVGITGELTLSGQVTAIGGLNLKASGAQRATLSRILFPAANHLDWADWVQLEGPHRRLEGTALSTWDDAWAVLRV